MKRPVLTCTIAASLLAIAAHTSVAQEADTFSPVASYQYEDSLAEPDTPIMSPVVSYQYYDWPGDENVPLVRSQNVSYLYGSIAADGLSISGPATIGTGTSTTYAVLLSVDGIPVDVTEGVRLSFAGTTPSFAGIGGTTLFVLENAPVTTVQLRATYANQTGQMISAPFTVAITKSYRASASAAAQHAGGTNYTINLTGTASGGTSPYTFRWDINNDGTYGDLTGANASFGITSQGGTTKIGLEVTDSTGGKAYAKTAATADKPPVPNQPPRIYPAPDIPNGELKSATGAHFDFNSSRTPNGLLVVTHGMYSTTQGLYAADGWLRDFAERAELRMQRDRPGNLPNIATFDWSATSDPGGEINPMLRAELDELARHSVQIALTNAPLGVAAALAPLLAVGLDFLVDVSFIRTDNFAPGRGQDLANGIREAAIQGYVDPSQPVHLIGHSAGGFVIGECALWLRQHPLPPPDGRTIFVDRVTMLDTPVPIRGHFTTLIAQNPPVVERYISTLWGHVAPELLGVQPGPYYVRSPLGTIASWFRFGLDGHALAHRWYRRTILQRSTDDPSLDSYGTNAFSLSPLLGGYQIINHSSEQTAMTRFELGFEDIAFGGFETFGDVTVSDGVYRLTEVNDAGLVLRNQTLPIGVRALNLRFKFTAAGDGDFLHIRFGELHNLFVGLDNEIARDGFTTVEVSVNGLDGKTGDLVVTLVSRGAPNAVAEVADFSWTIDPDADADGLTNDEEAALGTDPLNPDTDSDGLSDGDEVNVHHTNPLVVDTDGDGIGDGGEIAAGTDPLDSSSRLRITGMSYAPATGVNISWTAKAGKTYQIQRSQDVSFATYEVIASNLNGVEPETAFTDASPSVVSGSLFYRVALQP